MAAARQENITNPLINAINANTPEGDSEAIRLLEQGFDPNTPDYYGFTPLHHTIRTRNIQLFDILIAHKSLRLNVMTQRFHFTKDPEGKITAPLNLAELVIKLIDDEEGKSCRTHMLQALAKTGITPRNTGSKNQSLLKKHMPAITFGIIPIIGAITLRELFNLMLSTINPSRASYLASTCTDENLQHSSLYVTLMCHSKPARALPKELDPISAGMLSSLALLTTVYAIALAKADSKAQTQAGHGLLVLTGLSIIMATIYNSDNAWAKNITATALILAASLYIYFNAFKPATRVKAPAKSAEKSQNVWWTRDTPQTIAAPQAPQIQIDGRDGRVVEVTKDVGNCLFDSVAYVLRRPEFKSVVEALKGKVSSGDLRALGIAKLKTQLIADPDSFFEASFVLTNGYNQENVVTSEAYIAAMSQDKCAAEGPIIDMLAMALQVQFTIIDRNQIIEIRDHAKDIQGTIILLQAGLHYQVIELDPSTEIPMASTAGTAEEEIAIDAAALASQRGIGHISRTHSGSRDLCKIAHAAPDGDCGFTASRLALQLQNHHDLAPFFERRAFIELIRTTLEDPSSEERSRVLINEIFRVDRAENFGDWSECFTHSTYWMEEAHFRFLSHHLNIAFEIYHAGTGVLEPEPGNNARIYEGTGMPAATVSLAHVSTMLQNRQGAVLNHFDAIIIDPTARQQDQIERLNTVGDNRHDQSGLAFLSTSASSASTSAAPTL